MGLWACTLERMLLLWSIMHLGNILDLLMLLLLQILKDWRHFPRVVGTAELAFMLGMCAAAMAVYFDFRSCC